MTFFAAFSIVVSYALLENPEHENAGRNVYPLIVREVSSLSHLLKSFLYYFLGQNIHCLVEYGIPSCTVMSNNVVEYVLCWIFKSFIQTKTK